MVYSRRAQSEALTDLWLIMCRVIHEVSPLPCRAVVEGQMEVLKAWGKSDGVDYSDEESD